MSLRDAAFAHPRGLPGRLGAMIMGRMTGQRNQWTISLLNIQHDDHILEVGAGPGALVKAILEQFPGSFITGLDMSPLMVQIAGRRLEKRMQSGHVLLREGSALSLPFDDASFDKAVSCNSVQLWPDQFVGVKEMYRVLKPGGLIALVLQPIWAKTDDEVKQIGAELVDLLNRASFQQTRLEFKPMRPISSVCALGIK